MKTTPLSETSTRIDPTTGKPLPSAADVYVALQKLIRTQAKGVHEHKFVIPVEWRYVDSLKLGMEVNRLRCECGEEKER